MELIFEWKNILDQQAETAFVGFLSTLIGEAGANKLVEVAKIYEKHDWFKLLIAKENDNITGLLALYYEPIHGSHEGWICVNPEYRKQGCQHPSITTDREAKTPHFFHTGFLY